MPAVISAPETLNVVSDDAVPYVVDKADSVPVKEMVGGSAPASPIWNELNVVAPVICVVVDVLVPTVGADHVPPSFLPTIKADVLAPPKMSPGTKVNVAL